MFYGMINTAAVNALVIYAHNMHKDQPEKKIKRNDFLLRIAHDLVTPFVTQRYKLSSLPRIIKTAIVMCGFVSNSPVAWRFPHILLQRIKKLISGVVVRLPLFFQLGIFHPTLLW